MVEQKLKLDQYEEEIKTAIEKLYSTGKYDNNSICKAFNLNNVGSVASIISLLMSI